MNSVSRWTAACLGLGVIMMGCSQVTEVSTPDLAWIVERDGVPFAVESIPGEVLDRLSSHRVVVVGETHLIREHQELMVEVVRALHARGFRQLLLEWPHMADWLLVDFVEDRQLEPGWEPPAWSYWDLTTAIRDFNRTLPADERVQVRGIDVNLQDYGGGRDFRLSMRALSQHLDDPGPVEAFLRGNYLAPETQLDKLETLRDELQARQPGLLSAWGATWYDRVMEMVEVELASVSIRALRDDQYDMSVQLREGVMKRLVDLRLDGYAHRTLINVGANHAQKKYLRGTDQEWLGDYLVHKSAAAGGSAFVLAVTPALVDASAGGTAYDIMDASPENELWRLMHETWPYQIVFLPLDDPVFLGESVPVNFEGTIYVAAPKRHYDAFVLLPLAHRIPLPSGS